MPSEAPKPAGAPLAAGRPVAGRAAPAGAVAAPRRGAVLAPLRAAVSAAPLQTPLRAASLAALLAVLLASLLAGGGCSYPQRFDNGLTGPEAPSKADRELVLSFERESDFSPLAGRAVTVTLRGPGAVLVPEGGRGRTDGAGRLRLVVSPVAVYDRSALKTGDIVVDYPAPLTVALVVGSDTFEWDLDAGQSFARYRDPLYRGLNRDPAAGPWHVTLTIP